MFSTCPQRMLLYRHTFVKVQNAKSKNGERFLTMYMEKESELILGDLP